MATIIINKHHKVKGRLSISRGLTENDDIIIGAILTTHRYFEEIKEIESERYHLTDVKIIKEDFGSNDFDIQYTLVAQDLEIKNGETNLPIDVIEAIEKEMYKDEKDNLIHEEVYIKWKSETK